MTTAMMLNQGTWTETDDIVEDAWSHNEDADSDTALAEQGYDLWTKAGTTRSASGNGPSIWVYERDAAPRFVLRILGGEQGGEYSVYAATVADVMQLLAQWSPAVPDAHLAKALRGAVDQLAATEHRLAKIGSALDYSRDYGLTPIADHLEKIGDRIR